LGVQLGPSESDPTPAHVSQGPAPKPPADDPQARLVSRVLASTEDTWGKVFKDAGRTYERPKLTLYTRAFPERWRAFRVDHLTDLLTQLRETVRTSRPGAVISAAVAPDPVEAAGRLQDWPAWLAKGLIDVVCPMASTTDSAAFASQMAAAREAAGRHPLWVGIGASSLSHEQIMDDILAARRIGAGGVGFSYDSLTAPARGSGYLSRLGKAAFSF